MLWDESSSILNLIFSRIQREQENVLQKLLDPKQDAAELRGFYEGLRLAKQTINSMIEELDKEKK